MILGAAILPAVAFIVLGAVALAGNAAMRVKLAGCPVFTVLVVYAVAYLSLAGVCLQFAALPRGTVAIQVAASFQRFAFTCCHIAFFPAVAVCICSAIAWLGSAHVPFRVAEFCCRIAKRITVAIAWCCHTFVFCSADLPAVAILVIVALPLLENALIAVSIASLQRITAIAISSAVARLKYAQAAGDIA